ncbi:MAG: glycosyltransferase family 39 protein [Pyrinomonadaceae bacterium]
MSVSAATAVTAGITPELFSAPRSRALSRTVIVSTLVLIISLGFGFRAYRLSAEGLSEDELNKLHAVEDYRRRGLTSTNGEHPMLMKALLTGSVVVAQRWNATGVAQSSPTLTVAPETALRLPAIIFGALTSLLIFLVVAELFGPVTGLIAATLWAVDPQAVGFNRIAKEDTFLLFFFLLANVFWLRGQRVAELGRGRPEPYFWATAAAFGAMLASKYLPHLLAVSVSYYHIFQSIPRTRWRVGKRKWLIFFGVMGAAFVACNLTILMPATWHEMRIFAGERRIGHDSYEFMGQLYRNQMTLWLKGSPWYFYYAFMAFKLPPAVLAAFALGLPLLFRRRLGDGRYFVLFWMFYWFFPFTLLGGKFLRYFTLGLPVVHITAAIGITFIGEWVAGIAQDGAQAARKSAFSGYAQACLVGALIISSAYAALGSAPHYRLYTNFLGGGPARAGDYFPHDEFYDGSVRETAQAIARLATPGATVFSETPGLLTHYARLAGRDDLISVSLSDPAARRALVPNDFVVVARGRRYFSNDLFVRKLESVARPVAEVAAGEVPAVRLYRLDQQTHAALASSVDNR